MNEHLKMNKTPWQYGKKMLCLLAFIGFGLFFFTDVAFAASDEEIISVLSENSDIFENNGIFVSALRNLGWVLIKLLVMLSDAAEGLFDAAFGFVDFTQYQPVQNFINSFKPVFVALICLSLVFLGIILILYHEKKPKIVINICIAILVVSSSTYMIEKMNEMISPEIRSEITSGSSRDENITYQVVSNSIYDLKYLDTHIGLMNVTRENRWIRDFDSGQLDRVDIDEVLKPEDVSEESQDLVKKTLTTDGDGNDALEDVNDGVAWTDFLNTYYFRYHVSWFQCMIALISLIIVYICLAYKTVRILYEIVIHQLLAYLYSANLTDNQKVVKVLNSLKDSYITLLLIVICMKIYLLAYTFINGLEFGELTKAFMLLFVALAVIDGPNIIQKLTGIDAGVNDGTHKMIAAFSGARTLGSAGKALWNAGKTLGGAGKTLGNAGKTLGNAAYQSHMANESMKESILGDAAQRDIAAANLSSDAKENAGAAMPGSVSNTSNSSEALNEGGSNLQAEDISSENTVNSITGGDAFNSTDASSESSVNNSTGGDALNTADISSENSVTSTTGGEELNTTDISSEDNFLEGSGFSEEGSQTEDVGEALSTGEVPAESISESMMKNNDTDPLTGESNGANDLARMEDELYQGGTIYDSGLEDSEAITYGGSMMQGMQGMQGMKGAQGLEGLKGSSSQLAMGRDIEGHENLPLSNSLGHNTSASGPSKTVKRESISNGLETKTSGHAARTHGDLIDKENLENL